MLKRMTIAAIALIACVPAAAQITFESPAPAAVAPAQASNAPKGKAGDPFRMICERVERTGSRLEVDKVCMTAAQWADHKAGHRAELEKNQQVVNQLPSR